ncbi:MAG: flagellar basal-body rod protein FlgG [Verrucomicrobiota bacterium]|nr:flagellar basal-body rod protein FlgG [Verrucomicrobiota bacterium]
MNLSLYSAATGMQAQQMNLDTIANNLANVNTLGFKKSRIEFQDLLYQNPRAVGAENGGGNRVPTGVEIGNGSQVVSTSKIFTQGSLTQTDAEMDIAIQGDGFFEVQRPDGTSAFTRDGSFKISSTGQVVTSDGLPVLSGFPTIPAGTTAISLSQTGVMTVRSAAGDTTAQIQLARFANPSGLVNLGGNTLAESPASGAPELGTPANAGFGSTMQGYVEGSNVNVVNEMVAMIMAQRAYEINSKSIQASDEMLQQVNNLKR